MSPKMRCISMKTAIERWRKSERPRLRVHSNHPAVGSAVEPVGSSKPKVGARSTIPGMTVVQNV